MAFGVATKVSAVLLAASVTGMGGWTIYKSVTPATVGDLLSSERHKFLEENSDQWEKLVQEHEKNETGTSSKPAKIQGLTLGSSDKSKSLRKKCKELWNTEISAVKSKEEKDRIKKELKDWCIEGAAALSSPSKK